MEAITCLLCDEEKEHKSRGLCLSCYERMRYLGQLEKFLLMAGGSLRLLSVLNKIEKKHRWSEVDFSEPVKKFLLS